MNILTISNYFPEHPGGIEFVAKNLTANWRKQHQVRWVACDVSLHPHIAEADDISIKAINLTEEKLGFPYPIPFPSFIKLIFDEVHRCEVVHMHDCLYAINLLAFVAAKWYHKPVILTQHIGPIDYKESYKNTLQNIAYKTLGKWVLENAEQVIFISHRVQKWFERKMRLKNPAVFIPNGVDTQLFYPLQSKEQKLGRILLKHKQDDFILLFIGRFTQKKGLSVIREIATLRPNWHWWLIGEGEIDPRQWQIKNIQVISPRPQDELRQFYTSANLFFLPSEGEGFPLVVQEAFACGTPTLVSMETASNFPESPLIGVDISKIDSIVSKLDELYNSPSIISSLSLASEKFAKHWDWAYIANQYDVFFKLISKKT